MSKVRAKNDGLLSIQGDLFDNGLPEGALDVQLGFRQLVSRLMYQKDRFRIAAEISRLSGREITKATLDKCVESDLSHGLRAEALPATLYVLKSMEPAHYLLDPIGGDVVGPECRDLFRLAKLEEEKRKLDLDIAALRSKCGIK